MVIWTPRHDAAEGNFRQPRVLMENDDQRNVLAGEVFSSTLSNWGPMKRCLDSVIQSDAYHIATSTIPSIPEPFQPTFFSLNDLAQLSIKYSMPCYAVAVPHPTSSFVEGLKELAWLVNAFSDLVLIRTKMVLPCPPCQALITLSRAPD